MLDYDDLFDRVPQWINQQPPMRNVWIVGGGKLINALRGLHAQHDLGEADTHWQAVDLLDITTQVVAKRFPQWPVCEDLQELVTATQHNDNMLFSVGRWLRTRSDVPESWSVTTDSIAALLARDLSATECVLLKSTLPTGPKSPTLLQLATERYCDDYFTVAAAGLERIRLVDFRASDMPDRSVEVNQ